MDCAPTRSQAWLGAHEGEFSDLDVAEAVALVEGAGLLARVVPYSSGEAAREQRPDRVNLWLSGTGAISAVDAG